MTDENETRGGTGGIGEPGARKRAMVPRWNLWLVGAALVLSVLWCLAVTVNAEGSRAAMRESVLILSERLKDDPAAAQAALQDAAAAVKRGENPKITVMELNNRLRGPRH